MRLFKQDIPFTMVANEVLYRTDISMKAKCMFAYLFSKPEGWQFAATRIAREFKEDRKTILAALGELEVAKILTRKRLPSGRVDYSLEYAESHSPESGLGLFDPQSAFSTVAKAHRGKSGLLSNTHKDSNTDSDSNTNFELFWEKYPRHENKKKAKAKWDKLPAETRAKILADIPRRVKSEQWMKGFVPHPTTYLNGERWEDEIRSAPASKAY